MRTTLDIADDVLAAAKEMAAQEETSVGQVISRLARRALIGADVSTLRQSAAGFPTLPRRGTIVTNEHVNEIREIDGI